MNLPSWLPWVIAGIAIVVWRRVVQAWMLEGRFGPQAAAVVYAAAIPVLVLGGFTILGRLGVGALTFAAIGFALSYSFALFSFRRAALIERDRGR